MSRVGLGFDSHAFDADRPLILGGVEIPGSPGLAGHSDADVLTHAVADALLGAAGLGDIGDRFPATAELEGANSLGLLRECTAAIRVAGWSVVNVDCTLIAEQPRLTPYRERMIENLAAALDASTNDVSIKATTTDGMGFTGRGEGIAAIAVAMIDGH
jgi:2-C-methyl-D-erythritol 2,4-cyclodiphosphate synthase